MSFISKYNKELYHYGVLGMKWGVRRGNVSKAYEKASKKLDKLDAKVEKKQQKANKLSAKADRKIRSSFASDESTDIAVSKATGAQREVTKAIAKADKWYRKMDATFRDTDISLSEEQIAKGKGYMDQLNMRSQLKYMRLG